MGALGWMPGTFWEATVFDLTAAIDGWLEKNGAGTVGPKSKLTPADIEELQELAHDGG